tara:strand:+ start:777 stop:1619 length:843 start_codon:yes stop_codon:yes gene_type:complete
MTKPKPDRIFSSKDLDLTDSTTETRFINNNTHNYRSVDEMTKSPQKVLETLALGAIFSSKKEFEADPTDLGPMGHKLLHFSMLSHMQNMEGIIKTFNRHGEDAVMDGEATVQRLDKKTGEIEDVISLTAVENLLQAAAIGTYVELLANISHQGDKEKLRILQHLLRQTEQGKHLKMDNVDDMQRLLTQGDQLGEMFEKLVEDYGPKIEITRVFPSASKLAEALSDHKDGSLDFMDCYTLNAHKNLSGDMSKVDIEILIEKARESMQELLATLEESEFPQC